MCLNPIITKSRNTGRMIEVDCGHCLECALRKSHKYYSLLQSYSCKRDVVRLFLTLTYSSDCVPYVRISEFTEFFYDGIIPLIHRDVDFKRYYNRDLSKVCVATYNNQVYNELPSSISKTDFDLVFECPRLVKRHIGDYVTYDDDKIGVLLYSDIQRYVKRVRKNSGIDFQYYFVGEYGSEKRFFRPHWHGIVFCSRFDVDNLKAQLFNDWYYCADSFKHVDYAINPSSYVSLYVTKVDSYAKGLYLLSPRFVHYSRDLHRFFNVSIQKFSDFQYKKNDGSLALVPSYFWRWNFPYGYRKNFPKSWYTTLESFFYRTLPLRLSSIGKYLLPVLNDFVVLPYRIFGFPFPKLDFSFGSLPFDSVSNLSDLFDYSIFVDTLYRQLNSFLIRYTLEDIKVIPCTHKRDFPLAYSSDIIQYITDYYKNQSYDFSQIYDFLYHQQINDLVINPFNSIKNVKRFTDS